MSGGMTMGQLASKFLLAARSVDKVSEQKVRALSQIGVGYVKEEIQAVHAVDTGTMLNSTQAEQLSLTAYVVGPTVLYAPYVALGTSRMAARPFHIRAARRLDRDAKDILNAGDFGL